MTNDSRIPLPDACVLRYVLDKFANDAPETPFAIFEGRSQCTYGELLRQVRIAAHGLRALAVKQGDHVLVWLPSGREALTIWFAINYLGAVYVPINTAYRGRVLEHVVANSDAKVAIVHADLVQRLAEINHAKLQRVVVLQGAAEPVANLEMFSANVIQTSRDGPVPLDRPIMPWDTQSVLYTSGTTGPSKGVLSSYLHLYSMGEGFPMVDGSDRFLINLPLFHAGGTGPVYWMLCRGGSITLVGAFSTDRFWSTIRETETTTLILLGVMAILRMPTEGGDHDPDR